MRTLSIPTLVKKNKTEDDMMFQHSKREKKIEIDENTIIEKFDGNNKII